MSDLPEKRKHKTGKRPWVRLDSCTVDEPRKDCSGYRVKIEGVNLRRAISPATVTVGGQLLREMEFASDGRSITGVLAKAPEDERVVVDYGFARAELSP